MKTCDDIIEELKYNLETANDKIYELYNENIIDDNDIDIMQNNHKKRDKNDDFEQ